MHTLRILLHCRQSGASPIVGHRLVATCVSMFTTCIGTGLTGALDFPAFASDISRTSVERSEEDSESSFGTTRLTSRKPGSRTSLACSMVGEWKVTHHRGLRDQPCCSWCRQWSMFVLHHHTAGRTCIYECTYSQEKLHAGELGYIDSTDSMTGGLPYIT